MSEIIYFSGLPLLSNNLDIPGLSDFIKIQKYFHPNAGVKDRSGTIKIPFKNKILNPLPQMDPLFNLNYKECAMSRMEDLKKLYLNTGNTFRLLYSGGIDSTVILASFIEYFGLEYTSKILEISCTPESINENPWAWQRYIAPGNFKVTTSLDQAHRWNENVITIQGEGNDHLFGGLGSSVMSRFMENMYAPADVKTLTEYLVWCKNEKDPTDAGYCAEQIMRIVDVAPMPITNMYLLNWWYKFVLDWEAVMIRVLSQSTLYQLPVDFLENKFVQFFNTIDFQQWSMKFHADYPYSYAENKNYKIICKEMILDILNIPEYADKSKCMSWPRVQALTKSGYLIDDDYKIYYNLDDFLNFVEPNNSFN